MASLRDKVGNGKRDQLVGRGFPGLPLCILMALEEERWVCSIVDVDRKFIRYGTSRHADTVLRGLAARCFGCRRLFVLLRRSAVIGD